MEAAVSHRERIMTLKQAISNKLRSFHQRKGKVVSKQQEGKG
jgi:hypothetical protein